MKQQFFEDESIDRKYKRFLLEISNFIFLNRDKCKNKFFNIYIDSNEFWIELEMHTFVDLFDRKRDGTAVIDPVFTLEGNAFVDILDFDEMDVPVEEISEYRELFKEEIEKLVAEEIPFELFIKWLD